MALFQSGMYNLAAVADQATFRWGVAMLPIGPQSRRAQLAGIAAAGNSASAHPDAVRQVLAWMGGTRGNEYLGPNGAAIPAVLAAQPVYDRYRRSSGVDVSPFFKVLNGLASPLPEAPDSPPGTTRSNRTSTRCSWAAATSRAPWPRLKRPRTLRRSVD